MSKQNITIYVNENGIIENPKKDIISENLIITINIKEEIKQIIEEKNIEVSFCDAFLEKNQNLKKIKFIDNVGVQIIRAKFLFVCKSLIYVDLSGLSRVTKIGDHFLEDCESLTNIDLSGLSSITQIGDYFLSFCKSLINLDLSGLSNVTQIGNDFLFNCVSLTEIKNLKHLSNLTEITDNFLYYCINLKNIDLLGLSSVSKIGHNFLSYCKNLEKINLSALSNVTQIGKMFLLYCENLTNIDLSGLYNLTKIGHRFLYSCVRLQKIQILPHQQPIILKYNQNLQQKLEINTEWYNTPKGKIWVENILEQCKNIQDCDMLLEIIDFL
jgi:hypothetical protein